MNDALETLVVDFQLRGYREAMINIKRYTRAVKEAAELTSGLRFRLPSGPRVPNMPTIAPMANRVVPTAQPLPIARAPSRNLQTAREIIPVRLASFDGRSMAQLRTAMMRNAMMPASRTTAATGQGVGAAGAGILRPLTIASAAATASLIGLTRAGLSGTVEGYRLESQFKLLAMNIASVFLPVIDIFTERLQRLNFMLFRMDGAQQKKLMGGGLAVAGAGIAAGGLATLLPLLAPVLGLFAGMAPVMVKLAIAGGPVTIALGLLATAVAGMAGVVVYLIAVSKPVRAAMWGLLEALEKVWDATKQLRAALYRVIETLVIKYFENLAAVIDRIASDPKVIEMLNEMAKAIEKLVDIMPAFIQHLGDMLDEIESRLGGVVVGIARQAGGAIKAVGGGGGPRVRRPAQGIMNVVQGPRNPFKDPEVAAKFKGDQQRRVTPFNPGREDATGMFNRFQDAFSKVGEKDVPKAQLEQLILIAAGQQALALALKNIGGLQAFVARPAPNGRPRNG